MHEAKWSRAKADADKRRTGASPFRAAISNARNERTSRLWARAALFEHAAAPGQARAAPVEHSAPPGWLERHPSSILRFRGRLERHPSSILRLRGRLDRHFSSILRLRGGLERPFRAICGSGRARAAISSHLRLPGGLEQPFRAICGSGPGSSGHMQQIAACLVNSGIARVQTGHEKPSGPGAPSAKQTL